MIYSRLTSFLDKNKVLSNKQFGFRNKHSTNHALISLTESIRNNIDDGNFTCGVFIDLQKAFDTVDHKILLSKLHHCGIRGLANSWFKSYLQNRTQSVCVSGILSPPNVMKYGVPQGSVLGPLLFLIYINDLANAIIYSTVFHFADDTSLTCSSSSLKSIKKQMNIDLKLLHHWLAANKIALNVAKTEVILFRQQNKLINNDVRLKLNGKKLDFCSHVKYLGILLDAHLSWKTQINSLSVKLCNANGVISKLRHYLPKSVLLTVYYAFFSAHATYSCQVWGQNLSNSKILKLQKTALRLLTFSDFKHPSKPIFHQLGILNIVDLVKLYNVCLVHQTLNNVSPSDTCSTLKLNYQQGHYSTRGSSIKLLKRPAVRTTRFGLNSVKYQCVLNWNTLQNTLTQYDLASLKFGKLKRTYKNLLLNRYVPS